MSEFNLDIDVELEKADPEFLAETDFISGLTYEGLFRMYWEMEDFPPHVQMAAVEAFRPGPSISDKGSRELRLLSAFTTLFERPPTLSEYLGLVYYRQTLIDGKLTWIGDLRFRDGVERERFQNNMPVFPTTPWNTRNMWEAFLVRARELEIDPGYTEEDIDREFGDGKDSSGCPEHLPKFDLRSRSQNMSEVEMLRNKVELNNIPMTLEQARNLPSGTSFRMRGLFGAVETFCQP